MSGRETYLGDGLYASWDRRETIKLRAPRMGYDGAGHDHVVWLEPQTWFALLDFAATAPAAPQRETGHDHDD